MTYDEIVQFHGHEPAKIGESIPCAFCGESVMESRIQQLNEKPACIPCYEKRQ